MHDHGFRYTPPVFDTVGEGAPPETGIDVTDAVALVDRELALQQGFGRSDAYSLLAQHAASRGWQTIPSEPPNPGFDNLDGAGQAAYLAASAKCEPTAGTYEAAGELSPLGQSLFDQLTDMATEASEDGDVRAEMGRYPSCMAVAGFPASDRLALMNGFDSRFYELLSGQGVSAPSSAAWAELRAEEVKAALADGTCRERANVRVLSLIDGGLREFVVAHERDFLTLDAEFQATLVSRV